MGVWSRLKNQAGTTSAFLGLKKTMVCYLPFKNCSELFPLNYGSLYINVECGRVAYTWE